MSAVRETFLTVAEAASLAPLENDVLAGFEALERIKRAFIESRPDILGGEPVLRGARLSARLIADLVRQGASAAELAEDYDVTPEQIDAAVTFDKITPRRGRPRQAASRSKA